MSSDLTWNNETRHLRDLKPQQDNPRTISESQAKRLLESWDEYNQVETLAIGPDGTIYNGHQRYYTLLALGNLDLQVDVRVSSRALTKDEWRKLTVFLHEGTVGEWDYDMLKGWDIEKLLTWGFDEQLLQLWQDDDTYTRKIDAPEYTPQGPIPELAMLYNDSKTVALIEEMDACDAISDEEREFLRTAAQRHTVLDFQCIANYYAHASPEMQELMENNALVIIDFNKAISQGFIELSAKVAGMVKDEYGNE